MKQKAVFSMKKAGRMVTLNIYIYIYIYNFLRHNRRLEIVSEIVQVQPCSWMYCWFAALNIFVSYTSGSQTVRRDALVRRFNFPRASRDNLVLCH